MYNVSFKAINFGYSTTRAVQRFFQIRFFWKLEYIIFFFFSKNSINMRRVCK